ncbi:hypothetical protein HXX76_000289 [Chlamydomonas incerta]|uniref:Uncharacterized protein n=1 Tax=Chlamydomonas incerta TaxID=51695 RepID=A0A835WEB1_CHLIN|nr:hypothetical protein HXX76_000289 [Chlamydomonas incerta]|eukprot:KAG2445681.1 hypothetical protein HXX76_000289 [Chlamydomonas incerta]
MRRSSVGPAVGAELALLTASSVRSRHQQSGVPLSAEGSAACVACVPSRPPPLSGAALGLGAASGLGPAGRLRRSSISSGAGSGGSTLRTELGTVLLGRLEVVEAAVQAQGRRVEGLRSRVWCLEVGQEPAAASPTAAAVAASAAAALTRGVLGGVLTHEAEDMSELDKDMRHMQSGFRRQLRELQRDLQAAVRATALCRAEAATDRRGCTKQQPDTAVSAGSVAAAAEAASGGGAATALAAVAGEQEHGLDVLSTVAEEARHGSWQAAARLEVVEAALGFALLGMGGNALAAKVVDGSGDSVVEGRRQA